MSASDVVLSANGAGPLKRYGAGALKGNVGAAAMLLKIYAHFAKHGDINPTRIRISGVDAMI